MSTYQNQVLCSLKEARDIVFEYASFGSKDNLKNERCSGTTDT